MTEEIRFMEGEFQRVVIGRDDVIVLSHPEVLSDLASENILKTAKRFFGDRKILILEEGMRIGAIGTEEIL